MPSRRRQISPTAATLDAKRKAGSAAERPLREQPTASARPRVASATVTGSTRPSAVIAGSTVTAPGRRPRRARRGLRGWWSGSADPARSRAVAPRTVPHRRSRCSAVVEQQQQLLVGDEVRHDRRPRAGPVPRGSPSARATSGPIARVARAAQARRARRRPRTDPPRRPATSSISRVLPVPPPRPTSRVGTVAMRLRTSASSRWRPMNERQRNRQVRAAPCSANGGAGSPGEVRRAHLEHLLWPIEIASRCDTAIDSSTSSGRRRGPGPRPPRPKEGPGRRGRSR